VKNPQDGFDSRRFPRSIGSDKSNLFSLLHRERKIMQSLKSGIFGEKEIPQFGISFLSNLKGFGNVRKAEHHGKREINQVKLAKN
jgi:hypothetical protein